MVLMLQIDIKRTNFSSHSVTCEKDSSDHVKKNCFFLVEFNNYLSLFDHCGIVIGFVFEPDSVSTIILVIFVSSICYCQLQR